MLLDKYKIIITIDIICYLIEYLGLTDIIEEKIVLIKRDFVIITNIIYIIY